MDAAGAAEGDRGERAGAEQVVDGGTAELEAGHDLEHGQQLYWLAESLQGRLPACSSGALFGDEPAFQSPVVPDVGREERAAGL